ncbi:hypothetical protein SAMN05192564_11299 [Paraburkholderia sartisoli]|uniref:Uncharacterized protein n=1 Tax=Paraburkholderia sartisoli TaxID=83784 RepID=A0A1H4HQG8_9BURK|nr:hypothetical protein SAMN05192564_11299 [Paraburkholderia sartisoli]
MVLATISPTERCNVNDALLPVGSTYWVRLSQRYLGRAG